MLILYSGVPWSLYIKNSSFAVIFCTFSHSFAFFSPHDDDDYNHDDDKDLKTCSDIIKVVCDLLRLCVVNVNRRLVPLWPDFNCSDLNYGDGNGDCCIWR